MFFSFACEGQLRLCGSRSPLLQQYARPMWEASNDDFIVCIVKIVVCRHTSRRRNESGSYLRSSSLSLSKEIVVHLAVADAKDERTTVGFLISPATFCDGDVLATPTAGVASSQLARFSWSVFRYELFHPALSRVGRVLPVVASSRSTHSSTRPSLLGACHIRKLAPAPSI